MESIFSVLIVCDRSAAHLAQALLTHRQLKHRVNSLFYIWRSPFTTGLWRVDIEQCSSVSLPHTIHSLWYSDNTSRFKTLFAAIVVFNWWTMLLATFITQIPKGPGCEEWATALCISANPHEYWSVWQTFGVFWE